MHNAKARNKRAADDIRYILGKIFIHQESIPEAGLLTLTKCELSKDHKIATIYFSFFEAQIDTEKVMEILESKKKHLRFLLGRELKARSVPELIFKHDEHFVQAENVAELLSQVKADHT